MFSSCFLLMFTAVPLLSAFSTWKPALWPGRHFLTLLDVRQGGGGLLFLGQVHLLGSEHLPGRAWVPASPFQSCDLANMGQ